MSDERKKPLPWKGFIAAYPSRWKRPFLRFEWVCEHIAYRFSRWAFIDVLEYAGKLSLLVAMIAFVWGIPQRKRAAQDQRTAKHYQAWQTINTALGQSGSGGRVDALEELHKDGVSLAGVNVSGAFLMDLDLQNIRMQLARMTNVTFIRPNFSNAFLWRVTFERSYFEDATFSDAILQQANFSKAHFRRGDFSEDFSDGFSGVFSGADLSHAYFWEASLAGLDFSKANLSDAMLMEVNLAASRLAGANLTRASLGMANLSKANLERADLNGADFELAYLGEADFAGVTNWLGIASLANANIYKIRNPPAGFIEWATNKMGAVSIPVDSYSAWTNWLSSRAGQ